MYIVPYHVAGASTNMKPKEIEVSVDAVSKVPSKGTQTPACSGPLLDWLKGAVSLGQVLSDATVKNPL
jgi:hypothetical protein